jgi:tetratricopeptide (TPR) repeat protein
VELLDHVLKRNDEACREAQAALDRWKSADPETYRQVQQTAIVTLLPSNPGKARDVLLQSNVAPEVVQMVVESLRKVIEDIRIDDPVSEKLKAAQEAYRPVAQQLYGAMAADSPPEQAYFFKQAMAYALESGSPEDLAKAAEMFGELSGMSRRFAQQAAARGERRGEDAANIWGLARCAAKLGQNDKATQYYDDLARGLPEKSRQWWGAQLERMRFLLKANRSDPKAMPDLLQSIKVLQFMDSNMGGYLRQFNSLSSEMQASAGAAKQS